jgi:hypothetical protein
MLSDFFRINLPYGISRNEKGEWMAFNREYMPLGFNTEEFERGQNAENPFPNLPVHTKYKGLTESILLKIAADNGGQLAVEYDDNGKINKVWLYNDLSNPRNQKRENKMLWNEYFDKLKILSKCEISK